MSKAVYPPKHRFEADQVYAWFRTIKAKRTMSKAYNKLLVGLLSLFILGCGAEPNHKTNHPEDHPPNIIYILADDLGYGDLGCFGQRTLSTPNIDRLAAQGMRFTQHYAGSTVCAPSRASLLTGKHAGHINVRGNQPPGQLIRDDEVTIPAALKEAGYASAIIGKWGIGHPPAPNDPARNGFNHHYGYINMWHAHNFYPAFLYENGRKVTLEGNITDDQYDYDKYHPNGMPEGTGIAKEKKTYVLGEFEKQAFTFMEENKERPFFLFLALNMPHANNEAGYFLKDGMEVPMIMQDGQLRPNYLEYGNKDWPNPEKGFAAMMRLIDNSVGLVESKLKELGLNDNTVVIFASDNGPHQEGGHKVDFFDSNGPLRGAKRDLYEGGIRVPMIAKWPGKIQAGSSSEHQSGFWDLLPTFCEIAGVTIPKGIDGKSLLPTLTGQADQQEKPEFLYWEFYEQGGKQAARKDNWKYIKLNVRDPNEPIKQELYDLSKDPAEQHNLVQKYPKIVAEMEAIIKSAHQPTTVISLFSMETNAETAF